MPRSYTSRRESFSETTEYLYDVKNQLTGTRVTINLYPTSKWVKSRTFYGTTTAKYRTFRDANGYLPTRLSRDNIVERKANEVLQEQRFADGRLYKTRRIQECLSVDPVPFDSSLTNLAWSKVRRKVLDQDFNAPVFLAEGKKTIDMISDTASRLARAYSSFRKGRFSETAKQLGLSGSTVHSSWLAYKYGWTPLLMDIHGAAKTLAEAPFRRSQSTIRASAKSVSNVKDRGNPKFSGSVLMEARAWVTVRVNSKNVKMANKLGLLNPLTVVWELIPFSFVADWFVNIGDVIAECSAFSGVTILDGGSSTLVAMGGTSAEYNPLPWDRPYTNSVLYRDYVRSPGVQTMPRLMLKSDPLDVAKITTSIALLRNVFSASYPARVGNMNYVSTARFPQGHWHFDSPDEFRASQQRDNDIKKLRSKKR